MKNENHSAVYVRRTGDEVTIRGHSVVPDGTYTKDTLALIAMFLGMDPVTEKILKKC